MARSLMNAVNKSAVKALNKRSVEIASTSTSEVKSGSSSSETRTIRNINNAKSIDYIYRQINLLFTLPGIVT